MSVFKNLVNKIAPKLDQVICFAKKQELNPTLNADAENTGAQTTGLNGSIFNNNSKADTSVTAYNEAHPVHNLKISEQTMNYVQQLQNEYGSQYNDALQSVQTVGIQETVNNKEVKSEAQQAADKLVEKLFESVLIPTEMDSYELVSGATLSLDELNNKLGTKFSTKYATDATIAYAKNMHEDSEVIYVDNDNKEHEINSKDDLKKYQQNVPENPNEIPVGSIVIMDNPNGGNFHSGLLVGYTQNGKALVVEGNSDFAKGGAAMVAYDFNSATEKSIKGYIPIKGLSDSAPQVEANDSIVDTADVATDESIEDEPNATEDTTDVVPENPVEDNTINKQDDITVTPTASAEQLEFQSGLEKAQELEDVTKTKTSPDGNTYHFDKDGNILYIESTQISSTNEPAPVGISDLATVDAIKKDDMNLDIFCKKYSSQYDKTNKNPYIEEVAKHITTTLAKNYNVSDIVDEKGNYTPEIKSLYSQIYTNNRELFKQSGYDLGDDPSVSQISETLATFSWDGDKTKDGTAKVKNDHINLSGITVPEAVPADKLITLYEYNEDNKIASVTKVSIDEEIQNPNSVTEYNPSDYHMVSKENYDYTSTEGYVNIVEQDLQTGSVEDKKIKLDKFEAQVEFMQSYIQAMANTNKITTEADGGTKYYDADGNVLYDKSNTGIFLLHNYNESGNVIYTAEGSIKDIKDLNSCASEYFYNLKSQKRTYNQDGSYTLCNKEISWSVDDESKKLGFTLNSYTITRRSEPKLNQQIQQFNDEFNRIINDGSTITMTSFLNSDDLSGISLNDSLLYDSEHRLVGVNKNAPAYNKGSKDKVTGKCELQSVENPFKENQLINYDDNGRISEIITFHENTSLYDNIGYKIGEEKGVPAITVKKYTYDGNTATVQEFYGNGDPIGKSTTLTLDSDGGIDIKSTGQGMSDYWLYTQLVSYSTIDTGKEAIKNAISEDDDNYIVKLFEPQLKADGSVYFNDEPTEYKIPKSEIFNILIKQENGLFARLEGDNSYASGYGKGDVDFIIMERAMELCLENIAKDKFKLNGLPKLDANYGPIRSGGRESKYAQYRNIAYALFGNEADPQIIQVLQDNQKKVDGLGSKEASIDFLMKTPVDELKSMAIQLHPINDGQSKDNSVHAVALVDVQGSGNNRSFVFRSGNGQKFKVSANELKSFEFATRCKSFYLEYYNFN